MSPKMFVRYTEDNPKWVRVSRNEVKINKKEKTAVVEAWGCTFDAAPIHEHPSDRFESSHEYIVVKHPNGNWLRVYWF